MKKIAIILISLFLTSVVAFGAEKGAKEYKADLKASNDVKVINKALDWFRDKKNKSSVKEIVNLLSDERDSVRIHALMAAAYIVDKGNKDAVQKIDKMIMDDSNAEVRYAAVLAKHRIGFDGAKYKDFFQKALAKEEDPYVKDYLNKMVNAAKGK